ncbi:MAG: nucleotidyltransferase substrate binding protein [Opitutus sp.]|nr:nucleotidyltransferase substrate binding protein [Opitutus sp.]MCS6247101.1 nucleotidyltransferase substrate binding protein [Opitutus sp.]MCS6273473.1 nucleotidyltransferase substrate binding protein [Opitutus sp.]MCS6275828.1 nucleotidyltransferase substrate binding protein [Opitutus sp.]MCS6300924.1 nucleotidyltransferase substrate binding protein [Opitutus sp.]
MKLDFTSLEQSIQALRRSLDEATPLLASFSPVMQDTVKSGIIQHFEVAYEQCWKAMKRWLETNVNSESVDGVTRRELFRLAAESRLISDVDAWMIFHRGRNETSHTYDADTAEEVYAIAASFVPEAECFLKTIAGRND